MKYIYTLFISVFFIIQSVFSQEKIISDLVIKGNTKTKTSLIKKLIKTRSGQVLDSIQLKQDITILKRLSSVGHAYFQVFKSKENYYNVFVHVQENFTIIPDISFWSATNNVLAYKVGLYEYNLLGQNITLGGFYQNNGFSSYAINFRAPTLFSKKWGLEINHQNWKSKEPIFFNGGTANYLYNNISTEALGLYQINFKNKVSFGINVFKEKFLYIEGDTDEGVPLELDVDKRLLKLVYTYDNLDYYFQYISGFKSVFYGQYVTSNNDFQNNFLIGWNDFLYFKRIKKKGNWANRLRIGLATNNDSPFAPFALDNNVNIRGVGILVDRGTGVAILNSEYRYTLCDEKKFAIQSNAFLDAGTWRNPGGSFSDFSDIDNMRFYSGVGLRFISKKIYNATFRVDYGFSLKDKTQGLVFGLGQYF